MLIVRSDGLEVRDLENSRLKKEGFHKFRNLFVKPVQPHQEIYRINL